jgi:hypothetical protein
MILGSHYDGAGFILQPLTVEPRYYYNLKEILKERKPVTGNYLSSINYHRTGVKLGR